MSDAIAHAVATYAFDTSSIEPDPEPVIPEAPVAAALPVVALSVIGGAVLVLRRRRAEAAA